MSVDERMVRCKHRSGIRQYMKDKPTKWGVKLWVLADSDIGYTVDLNVYVCIRKIGVMNDRYCGLILISCLHLC